MRPRKPHVNRAPYGAARQAILTVAPTDPSPREALVKSATEWLTEREQQVPPAKLRKAIQNAIAAGDLIAHSSRRVSRPLPH